jgi:hypothetical protein
MEDKQGLSRLTIWTAPLYRPMKTLLIRDNAFYNNRAITLIGPQFSPLNDHCFVKSKDHWHFLTTDGRHAIGGNAITDPMEFTDPFSAIAPLVEMREFWAPCSVVKDNTAYIFYASPKNPLKSDWRRFQRFAENGVQFTMILARAPLSDFSSLTITDELFEDAGGARDPFVFWDDRSRQWIMLYAKRIYENTTEIESGIAYRTSSDLVDWSDQKGYVVRGLVYDDEIRENVTVAIGNGESPQLVQHQGYYYLLVTHVGYREYHRTKVWVSDNPLAFEGDPVTTLWAHAPEVLYENGKWYISNCGQHHKEFGETGNGARVPGIEIAELLWA